MLTGAVPGYQRMVLDAYADRLRELATARNSRLSAIGTPAQAGRYRDLVRREVGACFGPLPPRTPLNPRVTGILGRDGYRIEKLVFESRPGFLVSANCYVPGKVRVPAPAVLFSCGHSQDGKAAPAYQAACQALVRNGFVVLVYDPIGQGERRERVPGRRGRELDCVDAHVMFGKRLDLLGEFLGTWRAWDGIRAHDYLRGRPEVDPARIGVAGNSGGGTLASYLFALDARFAAAAPGCYVTTFLRNLTNELPADLEQYPPGMLRRGLDQADLLIAGLPRPVLLLGQRFDYFDDRGFAQAAADVARVGRLLGMSSSMCGSFLGPQGHGLSPHLREAMVRFFGRCFRVPVRPGLADDPLPEARLVCAPGGRVAGLGSRSSWSLAGERAAQLRRTRGRITRREEPAVLGRLLCLPRTRGVPDYTRPTHWGTRIAGVRVSRFGVETGPGIFAILTHVTDRAPTRIEPGRRVSLWLPHVASSFDLRADPLARSLHRSGEAFYLDVRGLGESLPVCNARGFFEPEGWDSMFHGHASMLGESYFGDRVFDVLRTLDLLVNLGARRVDLYGRGLGSLLALCAGCLHPYVGRVTLKNSLSSFEDLVRVPNTPWPPSAVVRGLLTRLDLPDLRRFLGGRVSDRDPWGPCRRAFR
jgi:cephalosporin-C deacetylase-like acetyl esterase